MNLLPKIRRGAALLLAALSAAGILSQQKPAGAHDLAARVDRHYDQLHTLRAAFTESYAGLGVQRTESGELLLSKPGKMRWDYSTPPGKIFLLDGKYAWFYAPGDSQVQRIPAKELDDLRSPLRFLLGHTKLEKELDGLTLAPGGNGQFVLSGVPKGQENRVSKLSLTVTAEGVITAIEVKETDDATTKFIFGAEQSNPTIAPKTFQFTPPAGVPVIDSPPPV
jgi:outer membrane lipoprotein carrier protein